MIDHQRMESSLSCPMRDIGERSSNGGTTAAVRLQNVILKKKYLFYRWWHRYQLNKSQ